MSTQILFTIFLTVNNASKRPDDGCCDTFYWHGLALRRVPRRIVVQQPATALAGHHGFIVISVAQIVPALRSQHHLACQALLIQRLSYCCPFCLCDSVVDGERVFTDLC